MNEPSGVNSAPATNSDSAFDLVELWLILWRNKWLIMLSSIVLTAGVVAYSLTLPNIYKSSALLSPQKSQESGGMAALAGQFGGLASMAGINIGGASDDTALHIEIIKSRDFVYNFIKNHDVKVKLMASKQWNKESNKLIVNDLLYSVEKNKWVREVKAGQSAEPSLFEVYDIFLKQLSVVQNKGTGLVTISFTHIDPNISKLWVEYIIQDINALMREQEIEEKTKSISLLNKQLEKTNSSEMKNIFYSIIEEQTKLILLAEVQENYVFKVIESPIIEERKESPNRAVIAILSAMFFGLVTCLITLFFHFIRRYRQK
jgi:uncharacterized protein involved in exopolysaccharide biosynthesis